jgi:hypothetical protein
METLFNSSGWRAILHLGAKYDKTLTRIDGHCDTTWWPNYGNVASICIHRQVEYLGKVLADFGLIPGLAILPRGALCFLSVAVLRRLAEPVRC